MKPQIVQDHYQAAKQLHPSTELTFKIGKNFI